MKRKRNLLPSEKKFIVDNFSNRGAEYCSSIINFSPVTIRKIAYKNNIHLNKNLYKIRHKKLNINSDIFINIKTKEAAYILGLIWADGNISDIKYHHTINIQMVSKDMDTLIHLFESTGNWGKYKVIPQNGQPATKLAVSDKKLYNFLKECDYHIKSGASAYKILNRIPENLKHYWFRGLIDGDGCFYMGKKQQEFNIVSTINQNWDFFENLLKNLNIKYISKRMTTPRGSFSRIIINNILEIYKFGNYIYKDFGKDGLGLKRKFLKFKELEKRPKLIKFKSENESIY